ncbi:MAG: imidazole glycerol phosphate synthase subunit HisH [Candidatus Ratteibacteria bacterium]
MVGIIKYGAGNIYSVISGIRQFGEEVCIIENSKSISVIEFLVLPGVGNFNSGMDYLEKSGLDKEIKSIIMKGIPFLGICLGFQLLFEWSEEGERKGLGILKGKVVKFKNENLKIPHMGWNKVKFLNESLIFEGIRDNSYFYFAHSYYPVPEENIVIGITEYGEKFSSVVMKNNIIGVQFHPEKSGINGLNFLKNIMKKKWWQ